MSIQTRRSIVAALAIAAALMARTLTVSAQGTAFTYQGRLNNNGAPANGSFDFRFRVASDALANNIVGSPSLINSVTVSNGLFTAPVDFGAGIFNGSNFWLQVEVRRSGGGGYTTLFPPQPLTPTPYAITAGNVGSGGIVGIYTNNVAFNNPANSFSGNGSGLTGLWQLTGNTGATPGANFLGTLDNQPLEFHVNGARAFRIEPTLTNGAVNIIGGGISNSVTPGVVGATIAGGGAVAYSGFVLSNIVTGDFGVVSGGGGNVADNFGFVGGGFFNRTGGQGATVAGGMGNQALSGGSAIGGGGGNMITVLAGDATVAGGSQNTSGGLVSTVGGGDSNSSLGDYATVSGGKTNRATGMYSTVPGGTDNVASGLYSFAAGTHAKANHDSAFVWADELPADFVSTAGNQFLIRASGGVGIGTNKPFGQLHVASPNPIPQIWITQNTPTDYTRLRMKVATNQFWEMDVSPGPTPALQFWTGSLRMSIDYSGNVSALSFTPTSDRNAKENFESVNPMDVLDKVAALPISRWNFKNDAGTTHLGPMAQDFRAAFNVGPDDKHIATVDADGVALAAIQGLNQKLTDELKRRDAENAEMKQQLKELKQLVEQLRLTTRME